MGLGEQRSEQILRSTFRPLCQVKFPYYQGRQKRYHTFDLAHPTMPAGFEDYSTLVIDLCDAANAHEGEAHLTIDEKIIAAGMSQRRPKPHVDGCFRVDGDRAYWGGGGPQWLHFCNDVGASAIGRMAVIVAASLPGCRAWKGVFNERPAKDGDLSHIQTQLGEGEVLKANTAYLLSPDCVHESMTFDQQVLRTFLRIALPVSFSEACVWD